MNQGLRGIAGGGSAFPRWNTNITQSQRGGLWTNYSSLAHGVNIARLDRVFVGKAQSVPGRDYHDGNDQGPYILTSAVGADWALRDSQLLSIGTIGNMAITGFVKSSDQVDPAINNSIGVSGFVINNRALGLGWGSYFDVQHESGASNSFGIEVVVKNKGSDLFVKPYSGGPSGSTYGIHIQGGGDNSYGGSAANPSAVALHIGRNAHTWNRGIVIRSDAITGTDGVTGAGVAIEMGKGHTIQWNSAGDVFAAAIRSDVVTSGANVQMIFSDNLVAFYGGNSKEIFSINRPVGSPVNNIRILNAATGVAPSVTAIGDDTNIDLSLGAKGTGIIRSNTAIKSSSALGGIGYATGAGGTVTQATNKSTAVTLNTVSGQITMNNAALGAGSTAQFNVNCTAYTAATDTVVAHHASGGSASAYSVLVMSNGANTFALRVTNTTVGSLGEAIVINYNVIKGASS